MDQPPLGPDADQRVVDQRRCGRSGLNQFPLRGGRQGNPEMRLPLVHPIHGLAGAIAHDRQHGANAGIILAGAGFRRSGRREDGAAQGATQPLQFVEGGLEERLRDDADQAGRSFQQIKFSPQTLGAELTNLEGGMGHGHPLGTRVIFGSLAAVTFALGFGLDGGLIGSGIGPRLGRKHLGGRLGRMPEEHPLESGDGNGLLLERRHDPLQRLQETIEQLVSGRRNEGTHLGQQLFQLRSGQRGDLGPGRFSHGNRGGGGNPWRADRPRVLCGADPCGWCGRYDRGPWSVPNRSSWRRGNRSRGNAPGQ
jgi:hypothetical protein